MSENFGGRPPNPNRIAKFNNNIDSRNHLDLGFKGPKFTWTNKRKNSNLVMERLDRCLANPLCLNLFPKTTVEHLTRTHSNHCPLILDTNPQPNHSSSRKPFRIEPLWLSHPSFEGLIHTYWPSSNLKFFDIIITLQTAINLWNKNTFGNISPKNV